MARDLRYGIGVDVDDTSDIRKAADDLDLLADAAEDVSGTKIDVPIEVDADTARRDVEDFIGRLDGLDTNTKSVVIAIEAAAAQRELQDIAFEIRELAGTDVDISARIQGAAALSGDLERMKGEIRAINSTEIAPQVDSSGLDSFADKLGELPGALGDVGGKLKGMATGPASVVAIGAGLLAAADHAADLALAVGETAQLTGDSLDFTSRLQAVWTSTGADVNDLQDVLLQMNGVLSTSPDLAAQLGINLQDGAGVGERFLQVIDGLNTKIDSTAERSLIASKAFGEEGVRQVNSMISRVGDLDQAMLNVPEAKVFDQDEINRALEMKQNIGELKGELEAIAVEIGQSVVPAVADIGAELAKVTTFAADLGEKIGLIGAQELPTGSGLFDASALASATRMGGVLQNLGVIRSDNITAVTDLQNVEQEETEVVKTSADAHESLGDIIRRGAKASHEAGEARARGNKILAEAAQAERDFADAVGLANAALGDADAAASAFATAMSEINEASDLNFSLTAADTVQSFDDMKASLLGFVDSAEEGIDWGKIDLSPDDLSELRGLPDELAAVTESIAGMRTTIQTELQAAFATGDMDAFASKAKFFREEVGTQFMQLFQDMGASPEQALVQVQALQRDLGLLPEQVVVQIRLTRQEQAKQALQTFSAVISTLPETVQVKINTAIAQGDIGTALRILNEQLINRGYPPIVLPVDADPKPAGTRVDKERNRLDNAPPINWLVEAPDLPDVSGDIDDAAEEERTAVIDAKSTPEQAAGDLDETADEERTAVIDARATPAVADTQLNNITDRHRLAIIDARATPGVADAQLNNITNRSRTATIGAVAHTGDAESTLAYLARSRTANIYANVIGSTTPSAPPAPGTPQGRASGGASAAIVQHFHTTVNAAVIGNQREVDRQVSNAVRREARLAGRRAVESFR